MHSVAAAQSSSKEELEAEAGELDEVIHVLNLQAKPLSYQYVSSIPRPSHHRACSCFAGGADDLEEDDEDFDALD